MDNKVKVRIFGQEYTVFGDDSKEKMLRIAAYVDEVISNVQQHNKTTPATTIAILSAINIANELFGAKNDVEKARLEMQNCEQRIQGYKQLWEEAKLSFEAYKDENQKTLDQNKELYNQLAEARTIAQEALADNIKSELSEEMQIEIEAIRSQYKDLESSFFDLQMENIRLKSEVEKQ